MRSEQLELATTRTDLHSSETAQLDVTAFSNHAEIGDWAATYSNADPFPHIVLDGLFPPDNLHRVIAEVEANGVAVERDGYGTFRKHRTSETWKLGPATRCLIEGLNSAPFLQFLERISGVAGLIPDPYLEGGGVHQIGQGGFLKVHTDFNWHRKLHLHRRINILLYLNPEWNDAWNGHLELWDEEMTACRKRVAPLFNRLVIFSTNDKSYHGHPDPLQTPDRIVRNSIALYYYTAERPRDELVFGESTLTNYRARPGEKFGSESLKYSLHQLLLRIPVLRRLVYRGERQPPSA
jgi:2OG-Fe(II) oxygenase superfamily